MRIRLTLIAIALGLSGCSQAGNDQSAPYATTEDAADMAEVAAPDIRPTAAPGVAFDYAIRLGVPDMRISALQEQHADACEKLGLARCQIVGMRYELVDEDRIRGQLRFMLTPDIARNFAKSAVDAAQQVDGKLIWSEFNGQEVQTAINASQQRSQDAQSRIDDIERELAGSGVSRDRRATLADEAARLRQQLTGERQGRSESERRLAKSPLTIDYIGSRDYGRTPLSQIADEAVDAGRSSLALLFTIFVYFFTVLLPWLVVAAILIYAVRWLSRRYDLGSRQMQTGAPRHAEDHPDDA